MGFGAKVSFILIIVVPDMDARPMSFRFGTGLILRLFCIFLKCLCGIYVRRGERYQCGCRIRLNGCFFVQYYWGKLSKLPYPHCIFKK